MKIGCFALLAVSLAQQPRLRIRFGASSSGLSAAFGVGATDWLEFEPQLAIHAQRRWDRSLRYVSTSQNAGSDALGRFNRTTHSVISQKHVP